MIKKEFFKTRSDGIDLYRNYSDLSLKIRQIETGNIYNEAIDIESSNFTYEETDIPIEKLDENME